MAVGGAYAACAGAGGFVLALLLGTEAVDWRLLAALPALILAAGGFLVFRRRPNPYEIARRLDARLHLADTLSTAIFYWLPQHSGTCDEETCVHQREHAARAAATVDVRTALPLRIPRRVLASLTVLTLLGAGLVLLRYYSDGRLDLRRPMIPGVRQWVRSVETELAKIERQRRIPEQDREASLAQDEDAGSPENSALDAADPQPLEGDKAASDSKDLAKKSGEPANGSSRKQEESRTLQQDADRSADSSDEAGSQQRDPQSSSQNADQPGTRSGLLAEVSDSLANLISALKPKAASASGVKNGQAGAPDGRRGTGKNGKANTPSSEEAPPQDQARQGEAGDRPSSEAGTDAMSNSPSGSDERGGSGAGHDDGNKEIQQAKQLDAMGKLSVILGKRSQSVSGNATVEVTSGHGELKTAYEARQVTHGAVDALADRDRIPIEFEAYVQEYFRELRKTRPSAAQKK